METIGLLSGIGRLPVDVALSAKSMGYRVIAVGVVPDIDPELAEAVEHLMRFLRNVERGIIRTRRD